MVVFKKRDSVPSTRYSSVCNVLRQRRIWLIPTYRVYRLSNIWIEIILHVLGEHNGTQTVLYRTNQKSGPCSSIFLIITIVVRVVKHQSVFINTCRRQESLRIMLGSSSI